MKTNTKPFLNTLIYFHLALCSSVYSQIQPDTSYFPLAMGNQWIYKSSVTGSLDTERVVDTQRVKGKLYYGIAAYSHPLAYWLRYDSNKVFIAPSLVVNSDTSNIKESVVYDFSAQVDTPWTVNLAFSTSGTDCDFNGKTFIISKSKSVTTPVGFCTNCIQFMRGPACADAGRTMEWFTRGLGRIMYYRENIWGEDTFSLTKTSLPTIVSLSNKPRAEITYHLSQNYPNPFNPSTNINFQLPERSYVVVAIFDALGRKIETLLDSYQERGYHSIIWDATKQSSGIYFCRIQTKGFNQTIKLVLVQ